MNVFKYVDLSPVNKNRDVKVGKESGAGQGQGVATQRLKSHKPEKARLRLRGCVKIFLRRNSHFGSEIGCCHLHLSCCVLRQRIRLFSFGFLKTFTFCPSCTETLSTASRFSNLNPLSDCKETIQNGT